MLKGKAAVVTGSTSGIGLGIARALGAQGTNIMLNGFGDRKAIEALMAELRVQYDVEVDYSPADMSRPQQVSEMIAQCVDKPGPTLDQMIDFVLAGLAPSGTARK